MKTKRIGEWLHRHQGLVLILALVIMLRIPSLFEPHRYADEEIYLTLGQGVRRGLMLYRDIHDNKPPLLYLTAAIAGNVFWFRFILMIVNAVNVVVVWNLAKEVFEKKYWARIIATLIFGILTTIPMFEGNIANGENFMIAPASVAVWWWLRAVKEKRQKVIEFLGIGSMMAIAFLYKVPVIVEMGGLMLAWWIVEKKRGLKFLVDKRVWLVITGMMIPIGLSVGYFSIQRAVEPYVKSALLQNVGYVSTWGKMNTGVLGHPLVLKGLVVLGVMFGLWKLRKKLNVETVFIVSWLVWAMYGALLSSRPYPHYLLEIMAPLSLVVPMVFDKARWKSLVAGGGLVLVVLGYWMNNFWSYQTVTYYQNFASYITGQKSKEEYLNFWQGVRRNYQIAEYIKKRTQQDEKIFVWGTEPAIYSLSERLPAGRYTVEYHVVDFNAYGETVEAIVSEKAKMIVVFRDARNFPELMAIVMGDSYILATEIEGVKIYRHINGLQ